MVLERAPPVRLLDLGLGGALLDAQRLVVLGVVGARPAASAAAHVKAPARAAAKGASGAEEAAAEHGGVFLLVLAETKKKLRSRAGEREGARRVFFFSFPLRSKK